MKRLLLILTAALLATSALAESPVVFVVRHAERADAGGPAQADPVLSETGRVRAAALAQELREAGIGHIYTSEYKRTQETAAPLANSLGVKAAVVPGKETAALVDKLKAGSGNTLVVGHSDTVPEIINALGVATTVTLGPKDYDDLFLVLMEQPPRLIHLHYR